MSADPIADAITHWQDSDHITNHPRYGEVYTTEAVVYIHCDGGFSCECPPPGGDDA